MLFTKFHYSKKKKNHNQKENESKKVQVQFHKSDTSWSCYHLASSVRTRFCMDQLPDPAHLPATPLTGIAIGETGHPLPSTDHSCKVRTAPTIPAKANAEMYTLFLLP